MCRQNEKTSMAEGSVSSGVVFGDKLRNGGGDWTVQNNRPQGLNWKFPKLFRESAALKLSS